MQGERVAGRVHFFWLLDGSPLPVPDGWTCRRTLAEDGHILQVSAVESAIGPILDLRFVAQVRYLQRAASVSRAESVAVDVMLHELPDFRGSDAEASEDSGEDSQSSFTVVHMTAAVPEEPSEEDIVLAFHDCLDLVQVTHRALHHLLAVPVRLPTTESAGAHAVVGVESIAGGVRRVRWPIGLFALNRGGHAWPERLSVDQLELLEVAEVKDATHDPISQVLDLRREALAAADLAGNTRAAVVMAATACETFIDVTISALLWEEGLTPEQGASDMQRYRETAPRLQNLLARRLGGSWDLERQPALRDWRKKVAASRNRVVHSGGLPGPSLADEACRAMFPLFGHILDRVCDGKNRARYPMTALIVAGRDALETRGGWTRRMRAASDEADTFDLQGVFARWYDAVIELRQPPDMRQEPSTGVTTLVITASGRTGWVEHDRAAKLARLVVPDQDVSTFLQAARNRPDPTGKTYSFTPSPVCAPVGDWVPEHQLVPGIALMRDPAHWYEPPGWT